MTTSNNKKIVQIIFCTLVAFTTLQLQAQDEVECITFSDNYSDILNSDNILYSILDKSERVNSNAGKIITTLNDVPDSIAICIYAATDIWESVLKNETPISLHFYYQELESDNDIETQVYNTKAADGTFYPTALYYNAISTNRDSTTANDIDAKIYINKKETWDCSHSNVILSGTKNMTFAMLRAIGVALGFGASVTEKTSGLIGFSVSRGYSVFDKLVVSSSGTKLSDITNSGNRKNTALENFVQCTEGSSIYVTDTIPSRLMYSPNVFEPYKSLVYLNNSNSLMHYDLKNGDKYLQVDTTTIKILNELGWNAQFQKSVTIVGDNIDETGITSAYTNHIFRVQNNTTGDITNTSWVFTLPLNNGNDTIICQKTNSLSFEIPAVENADKYNTNINGDIYGTIFFSGNINGEKVTDSYRVSLELKPTIKNVVEQNKVSNSPLNSYNYYFTVEYYGCDQITVYEEEEYSTKLKTIYVKEPFLAHVEVNYISSNFYAWIDIIAENKYGSDMYTIELPPYNASSSMMSDRSAISQITENDYTHILVYNLNGTKILKVNNKSDLSSLQSGIYILKIFNEEECIKNIKYFKQ